MDQSDDGGRVDDVNRPTWLEVVGEYAIEGWSDPGELGSLTFVADRVRGLPILDLGVGGGRTVSLLRLLSGDYLGIDYTPALVALCRSRHPGVEIELGDARDLSGLAEGSRGLVVFSNNGIDAVDHEDRQKVLAGVHRVLEPGGTFVFSTLNKDNPLFGAHPGTAERISWVPGSLLPAPPDTEPAGPAPQAARADGAPRADGTAPADDTDDAAWLRAVRNWRRLRQETRDEGEWGMAPFAAHEFGLVTHFVTVGGAVDELDRHGFDVSAVFPCDGVDPQPPTEPVTSMYMHLVAHRRA